jgi:hypothetical protein
MRQARLLPVVKHPLKECDAGHMCDDSTCQASHGCEYTAPLPPCNHTAGCRNWCLWHNGCLDAAQHPGLFAQHHATLHVQHSVPPKHAVTQPLACVPGFYDLTPD